MQMLQGQIKEQAKPRPNQGLMQEIKKGRIG